jgi:hypothetical protein
MVHCRPIEPIPPVPYVEEIGRPRSTVSVQDRCHMGSRFLVSPMETIEISRPDLGRLIRQMACWVTLTRETIIQRLMSLAKEKFESCPSYRNLYQTLINQDDIPQLILFDVLCRSPQLTMLSLMVPKTADGIEYSALMTMVARNRQSDNTSTASATGDHDQALGISRSLASIQLCLDLRPPAASRSRGDGRDEQDLGFDHQDYWPLLIMPNVVRVYCYGDDASFDLGFLWEEDDSKEEEGSVEIGAPPKGYLQTVREIHLDASSSGPKSLYSLCRHAPQLEVLRVTHRRHSQEEFSWGNPNAETFDSGLLMRASTLRHLHLDFYDSTEYISFTGKDGRLASLPQLRHLETLHIQLQTLFGAISAIYRRDIGSMFPSSLIELTLHDQWPQDVIEREECIMMYSGNLDPMEFQGGWIMSPGVTKVEFWYSYRKAILRMLMRLCNVSAERLPRLRRLSYVSDYWSCRGWERENPFGVVQARFSEKGIEFHAGEELATTAEPEENE